MSIFAAQPQGGRSGLFEMHCGKCTLAGTTVTSDPRKGALVLKKSEDGLMHLIWKDRGTQAVEDDLIVFQGDATLRHLPQCKDGFVMLLEFTQTKRKLFFWSQERRKKGLDFSKEEDVAKEKELLEKANRALNGTPEPAPAAATGFGGLTHSELMAMLSGGAPAAPFSAANLSNILAAVQQQNQAVPLSDVIGAAAESGVVDSTMEQRLAEHLPADSVFGESVAGSLNTPQVQQDATPAPAPAAEAMETEEAKDGEKKDDKMDVDQ
jgi:hypothetical protein